MATKKNQRTQPDRERREDVDDQERERMEHPPDERGVDTNPDAITGEPGSHPVGAGLGAAAGGAALGGAAGAVAGPLGAGIGAVVGGIAGAYVGKELAEQIDPTAEEAYWREEYPNRKYYTEDADTEDFLPAYRYGWESRSRHHDRTWDEVEPELGRDWQERRGESKLEWKHARPATQDAWERVERMFPKASNVEKAEANTQRGQPSSRSPRHNATK